MPGLYDESHYSENFSGITNGAYYVDYGPYVPSASLGVNQT